MCKAVNYYFLKKYIFQKTSFNQMTQNLKSRQQLKLVSTLTGNI